MNKIITIPLILVLSSCSSNQIKTSEAPIQTPFISQPASPPKAALVAIQLPSQTGNKSRHHSIIELSGKSFLNVEDTDKAEQSAQQESWLPRIARYLKQGVASWYGPGFHGKKTANGEIFDMYEMTAAHKTLPIPSYAQVTNLENNKTVVVRINDRGPYSGNRLMDLSYAAAKKLGIQSEGTGKVEIKAISAMQALPQIQKTAESQNKKVYFQVGSFGSESKALKLQDKIAAHNLPEPTIHTSKQRKNTLYKVQMGPIKSKQNAEMLSYQLAKIGIKDPQIVTATRQN
ncbi:septal ring lytic transglycosylase RlpA family protein [Methyloglobulus sp.]|uniref:septal ring lytic transglycosylase RlpA family protein n=1 Tax=Methyloglobulus sp. TaxID=2518622 RepID=UPI0032B73913